VHSPQNRNPKKTNLGKTKKIEKIIIAIVSASNILQKKRMMVGVTRHDCC